jgi:superfamily II RNA helicase
LIYKGTYVNESEAKIIPAPKAPLQLRLPLPGTEIDSGELLDRFLDFTKERGVELYPAQEEALLALFDGANVILNTPTGSGKSLVATALHFCSLVTPNGIR